MKKYFFILFFILCKITFAHSAITDTLNYTDKAGKRQGKWVITNKLLNKPDFTPDQKVEEGKYIDSKKIGIWLEYFPNNRIKTRITYEAGKPIGHAVLYHDNGKVKEEGLWNNSRWVGEYKLYYDNGEVQQAFNFNASGKREGLQQYFYDNGQLMIEGNWEGGKEAGLLKEYYENGDLRSEKFFNGGNIDAASVKIYYTKKPVADTKTGKAPVVKATPVVKVNPETEKSRTGKFIGNGPHKLYNSSNQITKDGVFENYRLIDGKSYSYNKDGILTRIAVYKDAKYVGDAVLEEQ